MKTINAVMLFFTGVCCCSGALQPPQDVAFKAKIDGTTQMYMEMLPEGFDKDKTYDLIIALHGHASDRKQFAMGNTTTGMAFREIASKYNMIAISPDYRAKTSWMGPLAEADTVQIINDMKSKYRIGKVFMVGGSMGATSALTFAVLHPDMVDGVAAMNGLANHLEYTNFQDAIAASFGGAKDKVPEEYRKRSAELYPEKLAMPVAFTVSENDGVVPPKSVMRLAEKLKGTNQNVLLISRPKAGHGSYFEDCMAAMEFVVAGKVKKTEAPNIVRKEQEVTVKKGVAGIFSSEIKTRSVNLGLKFYVEKAGKITRFCLYQTVGETGSHTLKLWTTDGKLILSMKIPPTEGVGWVDVVPNEPIVLAADTEYIISCICNSNYQEAPAVFPLKKDGIMAITGLYSADTSGQNAPETSTESNYLIDLEYEKNK